MNVHAEFFTSNKYFNDLCHNFHGKMLYDNQEAMSEELEKMQILPFSRRILHAACGNRNPIVSLIKVLIACGANVNEQTSSGNTPLHFAISCLSYTLQNSRLNLSKNLFDIPKLLMQNGADLNICNKNNMNPLLHALSTGYVEIVELFLKEEDRLPNIEQISISERCLHLIKCLLNERKDYKIPTLNYCMLLHFAILQNNEESIKYVLQNTDCDIHALDTHDCSLMFYGIIFNKPLSVKVLLEYGVPVNQSRRCDIQEPVQSRVGSEYFKYIRAFNVDGVKNNTVSLDYQLYIIVKSQSETSALDLSCKLGNLDIVKILLSRGANIKKEEFTTLHYAIIGQNPDVVRLFLQLGIDVNCRCEHNGTPLQYALKVIKQNCEEIVDVLLNYGADVNLADEEKATPLHLVFPDCNTTNETLMNSTSKAGIIKRLLKFHPNVNAVDERGCTPIFKAQARYIIWENFAAEYGLNVNENPFKPDLEILIAFCTKMIEFNKEISIDNKQLLEDASTNKIYEECKVELKNMRKKITSSLNLSFLDILKKDTYNLGRVFETEDFRKIFTEGEYKKEFPHYADECEERILAAQRSRPVIDLGINLFKKDVYDVPFLALLQIFGFLNLKDVDNFVDACSFKVPLK